MQSVLTFLLRLPIFKKLLNLPRESWINKPFDGSDMLCSPLLRHALSSPLTTLKASLEEINQSELRSVEISRQATNRLMEIINQLDERGTTKHSSFLVKQSLTEIVSFFEAKYAKNFYKALLIPESTKINGSALYFQEAIICLLNNAFEAYTDPLEQRTVFLLAIAKQKYLRIEVVDFGKGMTHSAAKLAAIKGVTFKSTGSGLGLPFVRKVVEGRMNGEVVLTSHPGLGTRVSLKLPLLA